MRFPRRLAQHQINGYTCGPAALRHALLCYGEEYSIAKLAELCETSNEKGTPLENIERAVKKLDYQLTWECWGWDPDAKASIKRHISHDHPLLLCVDRDPTGPWVHWITVVGATDKYVAIVDSGRDGRHPYRRTSWNRLLQRLAVFENGQNRFDLYPLIEAA